MWHRLWLILKFVRGAHLVILVFSNYIFVEISETLHSSRAETFKAAFHRWAVVLSIINFIYLGGISFLNSLIECRVVCARWGNACSCSQSVIGIVLLGIILGLGCCRIWYPICLNRDAILSRIGVKIFFNQTCPFKNLLLSGSVIRMILVAQIWDYHIVMAVCLYRSSLIRSCGPSCPGSLLRKEMRRLDTHDSRNNKVVSLLSLLFLWCWIVVSEIFPAWCIDCKI